MIKEDTFAIDDAFIDRTLMFQAGDWLITSFMVTNTQNVPGATRFFCRLSTGYIWSINQQTIISVPLCYFYITT